jgi:biotin carboxylase
MQGPAIRIAGELGLETVVVDGNKDAHHAGDADIFEQIDLKDKDGITELALRLKMERGGNGLSGVMTAGTDFSATVAWVAERTGLPGIPYEAALNASDKSRMRACFKKAGVPSPEFFVIERETYAENPPKLPFSYPVVVKPVDNMGGRGCKRADNDDELLAAIAEALNFSRSGRAIVEEYMDGPEYSVDAIVYDDIITVCGLADRHIFFPPYFIEMGHTMPAQIEDEASALLLETFKAGVRSLGLTLGAAKGDIKFTSKGPMVGEIAARLSGGYMSGWTYPYSSGAEPTEAAILTALGRLNGKYPQGLRRKRDWVSAERAFISIPGVIKTIKNIYSAQNGAYVKDIFSRVKEQDRVIFPENNVSKCGNVISAAPDREIAIQAAEDAVRGILIRLCPQDMATDEFLAGLKDTGPDAFAVSGDVRQALENIPYGKTNATQSRQDGHAAIVPFPALLDSGACDYAGRGVSECLEAVRELTGRSLPLERGGALGREFWSAMLRGGYQGGAYMVDCLG